MYSTFCIIKICFQIKYSINNPEKFIEYYTLVNSFNLHLPETTYWEETMIIIENRLNSTDKVREYFNDNK